MFWREASAAYEAGCLSQWFNLPIWQREWIVATVEMKVDIHNAIIETIRIKK